MKQICKSSLTQKHSRSCSMAWVGHATSLKAICLVIKFVHLGDSLRIRIVLKDKGKPDMQSCSTQAMATMASPAQGKAELLWKSIYHEAMEN